MMRRSKGLLVCGLLLGCVAAIPAQVPTLGPAPEPDQPLPQSSSTQTGGMEASGMITGMSLGGLSAPFDITNRADTAGYFLTEYAASQGVAIGWTGTYSPINPGTTSQAFRNAIIRRVNLFRAFAGVPNTVVENPTLSAKAQQAAMMMSVDNSLDHHPTPAKFPLYYTADGDEAAGNSNLYLGRYGVISIDGYMEDPGNNNLRVGHRNWIIDPPRAEMGTGDVPGGGGGKRGSNALWVNADDLPSSTMRDGFVAWPPPGYVPSDLAYPRWSFKKSGIDLTAATVEMTDSAGNSVSLSVVHRPAVGDTWYPLVWEPVLPLSTASSPRTPPVQDEAYHVKITGTVAGQPAVVRYTVTLFDPENPKPEVAGIVFLDLNDNGIADPGEELPHNPVVANGPGGETRTFSRADGRFSLALASPGTYTLSHPTLTEIGTTTVAAPLVSTQYTADLPLAPATGRISGRTAANVPGQPMPFKLEKPAGFEGYQLLVTQFKALSRIENAEPGTFDDVEAVVPSGETLANLLDPTEALDTQSFHFHHADAKDRGIILNNVQPGSNSVVRFASRLKLSLSVQVARVQVAPPGSNSWSTIWSQAGNGSSESGFQQREVSLAAYAGQTVRVRFFFDLGFGTYYPQTHLGWVVDDIEITEDQTQGAGYVPIATHDVTSAAQWELLLPEEGDFQLQLLGDSGGNQFPVRDLPVLIDPNLDPTPRLRMLHRERSGGLMTLECVPFNFVPYRVSLHGTSDLGTNFQELPGVLVEETATGGYTAEVPVTPAPGTQFYQFVAEE